MGGETSLLRKLLALALLLGSLQITGDCAEYDELYAAALVARKSRELDKAVLLLQQALQRRPDSYEAQLALGITQSWLRDYDSAVKTLKVAAALQPESAEVRVALAHVAAWRGNLADAEEQCRQILRREDALEARQLLARVLAWQKKYDDSQREYLAILKPRPEHGPALLGLAEVLLWQEQRERAEPYLRRAAELGFAEAQFKLGRYLLTTPAGVQNAIQWLTKAADQEMPEAETELGLLYRRGELVTVDPARGLVWLKRGAEHGSSLAQRHLAECFYFGQGTPRDLAAAFAWYKRAAEQGDVAGAFGLARMYKSGEGCAKDEVTAKKWVDKATQLEDLQKADPKPESSNPLDF